jgi:2-keto-4-pentenoate hydratase
MLTKDQMQKASAMLIKCNKERTLIDALPEELRPRTRAEGYAIQAFVMRETSHPLLGWKIAATSLGGQKHVMVDEPFAGRILREIVLPGGGSVPLNNSHMSCAEFEFGFRFGQDLPPRAAPYSMAEVMEHVAALFPAIESPDCRYTDFTAVGGPQLIADNACGYYFVFGDDVKVDWRKYDLAAHQVHATRNGKDQFQGCGANVLDDPRNCLLWLANELSGLGITLKAGQAVSTGTCIPPVDVKPGDTVEGDFGDFGKISAKFV